MESQRIFAKLRDAVETLAVSIGSLIELDEFAPISLPSGSTPVEVETVKGGLAAKPVEAGAIRGLNNVHARFKRPHQTGPSGRPETSDLVASVLYAGGAGPHGLMTNAEQLTTRSRAVQDALQRVTTALLEDVEIRTRLRDQWGLRAADAPDDDTYFSGLDADGVRFLVIPFLVRRFEAALGSQVSQRKIDWKRLGNIVADGIVALASKTHHSYRLVAFLNSPAIDSDMISLGRHQAGDTDLALSLVRVTDSMIADAFRNRFRPPALPAGLAGTNSAVSADFRISANSTTEAAEAHVAAAIEAARSVVDLLRILRSEDLGIGHAYVATLEDDAPTLTPATLWTYQEAGAAYAPRRGAFGRPGGERLSDSDIGHISNLIANLIAGVDLPGFRIAIRRFRDIYERYWPGDPEALLDTAIALEALFLNDQETKELRHRLSLRVARLLSVDRTMRYTLVKDVKQLYDLRSKIAHGATLESMRRRDAKKLAHTMARAPQILRVAFLAFLTGAGPHGIKDRAKLTKWWLEHELS